MFDTNNEFIKSDIYIIYNKIIIFKYFFLESLNFLCYNIFYTKNYSKTEVKMDIFVEQLVRKPSDGKTTALKVLIAAGMVIVTVLCVLLMFIGFAFGIIIAAGAIYGGIYLMTGLDAEYEYIVTNGEMDIDKIIAKRKRKRLITAKASSFERFGKLSGAPQAGSGVTVVKADGISSENTETYYADFTHPSMGNVRLIFSPEEKVVDGLKPFLPRLVKAEFERSSRQ